MPARCQICDKRRNQLSRVSRCNPCKFSRVVYSRTGFVSRGKQAPKASIRVPGGRPQANVAQAIQPAGFLRCGSGRLNGLAYNGEYCSPVRSNEFIQGQGLATQQGLYLSCALRCISFISSSRSFWRTRSRSSFMAALYQRMASLGFPFWR